MSQVLFCRLTDEQRAVYKSYIESGDVKNILDGRFKVFVGLINLRKICNHPDLYDGGPKHFGIDEEDEALLPDDETYGYWRKSGKMIVTEALLKLWKRQGHRVLLFTQSREMHSLWNFSVLQNNDSTNNQLRTSTNFGVAHEVL